MIINLLFAVTLLASPSISYQGLLGEFIPYNAYQFVDLIEDGDFQYARNDFIAAESIYQQAYDYALKLKNYKLLTVSLISLGTALGEQRKTDAALDKFRQALNNKVSIYDQNLLSILYFNLGTAYYNFSQPDSAIINYTFAIELDSGYIDAYKNRGLIYGEKSEFANAIENYNQVIELKPDYADVMVMIADAYLTKDDRISAKHWYEQTLQNKALLKDFTEEEIQARLEELSKFIHE